MLRLSVPHCKHRSKSGGDAKTKSTVADPFARLTDITAATAVTYLAPSAV